MLNYNIGNEPHSPDKRALIFSTSAMIGKENVAEDYATLREKLESKGYEIVDEFMCTGFNTNSFMRYLGGMSKGRPNGEDLKHAEEFAQNLQKKRRIISSGSLESFESRRPPIELTINKREIQFHS